MADGSHLTPADADPSARLPARRDDGQGRRSAPDEVWAAVREDYLAGMSGPEACERHGVRLSALRDRAAREGWRRADQPWIPANRLDPWDEGVELEAETGGDLDRIELRQLSYVAFRRMMRAVLRGDAAEALRWRRVREAMDAEEAEIDRAIEQDEAIRQQVTDRAEADAADAARTDSSDASDSSDGVFGPP